MKIDIIELEKERLEWSLKTFTEATAVSSLRKLESEIKEVEAELLSFERKEVPAKYLALEYADCLMCLFDSAGRAGITPDQIVMAFKEKLEINKARNWVRNGDNTYSHVKP